MKLSNLLQNLRRHGHWLGLLGVIVAPSAGAINQEIRALFTPDSANPRKNEFINTTPSSGYCLSKPGECRDNNMFSIRLPLRFESNRAIQPGAAPRNGAMFKVPAQWRELTVRHTETGESAKVEVRIAGIGTDYILSDTAMNLTGASNHDDAHRSLWNGGGWVEGAPPCSYAGVGLLDSISYRFFWKTPVEADCVKVARFLIPAMSYNTLDFAYELRTPNPLEMSSGLYTGDINYRIGPGADFDMGDVMESNDSNLTLDFVLDVQHTLKVDIPPGGDKVELAPLGGWQAWLHQGQRPTRVFRDQVFHISASSRFKVTFTCGITGNINCLIRDPLNGRVGEVRLSITLPDGLNDINGQPVRRMLLSLVTKPPQFNPAQYVNRGQGILHFEIPDFDIRDMLRPGRAARYSGSITVIWDSEV
jgi:hypothetical protein